MNFVRCDGGCGAEQGIGREPGLIPDGWYSVQWFEKTVPPPNSNALMMAAMSSVYDKLPHGSEAAENMVEGARALHASQEYEIKLRTAHLCPGCLKLSVRSSNVTGEVPFANVEG